MLRMGVAPLVFPAVRLLGAVPDPVAVVTRALLAKPASRDLLSGYWSSVS